jgi:hypothetical protein
MRRLVGLSAAVRKVPVPGLARHGAIGRRENNQDPREASGIDRLIKRMPCYHFHYSGPANTISGQSMFTGAALIRSRGPPGAAGRAAAGHAGPERSGGTADLKGAAGRAVSALPLARGHLEQFLGVRGADFDADAFEHVAAWDAEREWIEMRLRSTAEQTVRLPTIGLTVRFAAGEEMRTEVSAKFRRERVEDELAAAGFGMRRSRTDADSRFGLSLSVPI